MKTQILDSSDEESENEVLQKSDIIKELEHQLFRSQNSADLAINLALIIHYASDRIFRSKPIEAHYKNYKLKATGLSKDHFDQIIENVSTAVKNILGIEELLARDSIKCFNSIFNSSIKLSQNLNQVINAKKLEIEDFNFTQALLTELQNLQPNLVWLSTNPLLLEASKEDNSGAELLSFSKVIGRNNKNTIKYYKIKGIDSNTTNVSYKLPNSTLGIFSEHHVVKNNGNTSAHIPNLGKYTDIFKDQFFKNNKAGIIENIFKLIKNEEPITIKDNTNYIDEKLTHLIFATEMLRNKVTLFTGPIFLELMLENQKADFPMSRDGATSDSRGISKHYNTFLPKPHSVDYDNVNVSNKVETQKFLKAEGQLIIIWLKFINEDLKYLFEKLDAYPSLIVINSKPLNQISVDEIIKVSDFLKTTEYTLNLTQETIDRIEYITKYSLQGVRPAISISKNQNNIDTNLESALQQNKSNPVICEAIKELKKLINELYQEYNKEKGKVADYLHTTQIENEIATILPDLWIYLSKGLKKWYNLDIDLIQLLKASGEKKDEFDSDKHEMLIEQSDIEIKKPFNQNNAELSMFINTKVGSFKEATFKEEQKVKLKTLLKLDINKLKKYFKSNNEESELKEDFSLLNKKRYLKQLDKEQKWGKSELEKFEFIKKQVKINLDHKSDQICNDLELVGDNIGGLLGKFSKVNKLGKSAAIEGLLGGLSGTAIEAGVDPLVADLSTLGIQGGASKSRNLLDRFSKSGREAAREEKVTRLLKDTTKEEGLDKLMNFNPENLDVIPVTAEVALNKDISNLHNAYAPNFTGIQSKMTANDEILRRKLNNIGSESNPTPIEVGEAGRAVISKKLSKLEKAREKAASPLYAKLEESPNLYPTENLNSYTEQAIAKELGDIEKGLNKNKSLLPDKYKRLAEKSKTELIELEKEVNKIITQVEKEYPGLSFQAKDQILNEIMPGFRKKIAKISGLKEKITTLESGYYRPGHIDKAITEIGNNITELKRSAKGGNDSLIRHYTKQKKALEADLEATPEGLAHREVYKEHSPEINKINRDRLLKKFVSKDEWDAYRVPADDLPRNIMSSPKASVANYMGQVKGTPAEKLTKAYFRDKYLDKTVDFEGGLPTYDKSSRFLRERGHKLDAIYSPEELGVFKQINEYLKNRASVSRGNSTFGSATMPKQQLQEMVRGYLGSEVSQPLALAKYVPWLPFKNHIAGLTRPNTTYNILEQALTDPIYAKSLLTREPALYSKPNYFPTLYNVLNGNQE